MKSIVIDGEIIKDAKGLHYQLAEKLSFPEWYGNNLDALHDCLTDINEPTEIELTNFGALKLNLGNYYERFIKVLIDCIEQNPNISVLLQDC